MLTSPDTVVLRLGWDYHLRWMEALNLWSVVSSLLHPESSCCQTFQPLRTFYHLKEEKSIQTQKDTFSFPGNYFAIIIAHLAIQIAINSQQHPTIH